jgi:hypothetical protein
LQMGTDIYHALKKVLHDRGLTHRLATRVALRPT